MKSLFSRYAFAIVLLIVAGTNSVSAQNTATKISDTSKSIKMKKVLLVGRLMKNIPTLDQITQKDVQLFGASTLEEVKSVFDKNNKQVDVVIMGAGIDINIRLDIIKYIFEISESTTVHMKDTKSGPAGMLPFVNGVLMDCLSNYERQTDTERRSCNNGFAVFN